MSKVYGLSGARAAYLCAPPGLAREIRRITPPWVVGLPAQVAAVRALEDASYYAGRWAETRTLRSELAAKLRSLGKVVVHEGSINSVLCRLPDGGPDAEAVCRRARSEGLFLRDLSLLSRRLGDRMSRISVRDRETNHRLVEILRRSIGIAPAAFSGGDPVVSPGGKVENGSYRELGDGLVLPPPPTACRSGRARHRRVPGLEP
jgi:histidinol-phosphate/aromatic aminotransferase/cobyric acid decarboxylase-like protein